MARFQQNFMLQNRQQGAGSAKALDCKMGVMITFLTFNISGSRSGGEVDITDE